MVETMTENEQQIAALQRQIEGAKQGLALGKALVNLKSNADFKTLITEGYLQNEAVRLVHLKSDPAMQEPHLQAGIMRDIDSIGSLAEYFRLVAKAGEQAERSIQGAEEQITEIEEEMANDSEAN